MMNYWLLMSLFFVIGISSFGGGYAMIPLMSHLLVDQWITSTQFNNILAISQATPGPFAVNMATYVGFVALEKPFLGAAATTFALALPSFILCLIAAKYYKQFKESPLLKTIMKALRPTIGAFILWTAFSILKNELFLAPTPPTFMAFIKNIEWQRLGLFCMLVAFMLTILKNKPIILIFMGAILAMVALL